MFIGIIQKMVDVMMIALRSNHAAYTSVFVVHHLVEVFWSSMACSRATYRNIIVANQTVDVFRMSIVSYLASRRHQRMTVLPVKYGVLMLL